MIKKSWNIKWNFRKKNQKMKNGDMWRPEKFTYRVFTRGCLNNYSTNYFVSTFPYIDNGFDIPENKRIQKFKAKFAA